MKRKQTVRTSGGADASRAMFGVPWSCCALATSCVAGADFRFLHIVICTGRLRRRLRVALAAHLAAQFFAELPFLARVLRSCFQSWFAQS